MQLSKRSEYALRALIDLGIAHALGRPVLQIRELAERERLPEKFLEQILVQLKKAGYLDSRRGQRGGYILRKPASEIVMGDVLRALEGPLAPIRCVSRTAYERCSCPDEVHCGLRLLMEDVRTAICDTVDRFTLADVINVTLRKLRRDGVASPFRFESKGGAAAGSSRAPRRPRKRKVMP